MLDQGVHENGQEASGEHQKAAYNGFVGRTRTGKMWKLKAFIFVRRREEEGHFSRSSKLVNFIQLAFILYRICYRSIYD